MSIPTAHMPPVRHAKVNGMEARIGALEKGCGLWTQQERPEEVDRLILDWMRRRIPQ